MAKIENIDQYIAQFSNEQQKRLIQLRAVIKGVCPNAEEKISWGMPTFVYFGNLVHFAQHKNHIGFYPADTGVRAFMDKLSEFECTKGSIHIREEQLIPDELIRSIVEYRMKENEKNAKSKKKYSQKEQKNVENTVWDFNKVMSELEASGSNQTKNIYKKHGMMEPLFGVTIKDMKPIAKHIKKNNELAMQLYATGNYDAMYFAGMIADGASMSESDFELWIEKAYCHSISDYIVAVTLTEAPFAETLADEWIQNKEELYQSAGWSCYSWLLGYLPDSQFNKEKIKNMLEMVEKTIHHQPDFVRYAMNSFVITVGISYIPLHEEAVSTAAIIGKVKVEMGETNCKVPHALTYIEKAIKNNRIGFKRKKIRC